MSWSLDVHEFDLLRVDDSWCRYISLADWLADA